MFNKGSSDNTGVDLEDEVDVAQAVQAPAAPPIASSEPLSAGVGPAGPPVSGTGMPAGGARARIGDRVFALLTSGASTLVVLLVLLVATFLLVQSIPAIAADKDNFLTSTNWSTDPNNLHFGVAALLWATVIISIIAMIIAVPIAIGIALFITHYAHAGWPSRWHTSSTCSPPSRRSSTASGV